MVKIKIGLKKGKRFILDVTRICTLAHYAVPPKAPKQTNQQTPSASKNRKDKKKWHTKNGVLLLKISLTVSWPGALLVSSFTLPYSCKNQIIFNNKSFEKEGTMQTRNEPMEKMRLLHSTRDVESTPVDKGAIRVH